MRVGDEKTRILILGQSCQMFEDTDLLQLCHTVSCLDMSEIEQIAESEKYDFVLVDMHILLRGGPNLLNRISNFRENAKVMLCAKMHEEAEAKRLTLKHRRIDHTIGDEGGEAFVADDYLLMPVSRSKFLGLVGLSQDIGEPNASANTSHQNGYKGTIESIYDSSVAQANDERLRKLEQLATTDELTGLKNRRYFMEFIRHVIWRAKKYGGQVTLLVFDIDNFKHYNDVYTHLAGDEILRQTAILINKCCREHDIVGRIGGDEFAVVFWDPKKNSDTSSDERRSPGSNHPMEPVFIADRLLNEIGNAEFAMLGPEGRGVLTISGGMATFPRDGWNLQQLYTQADKALMQAKQGGKNRIYLVGEPERLANE